MKGNEKVRFTLDQIVSSKNEDNWWRVDLFEKNTRHRLPKELEVVTSPPSEDVNYNCFVYALGLQDDPTFLGQNNWQFMRVMGKIFENMVDQNLLLEKESPEKGDMIMYRTVSGNISHVGLMLDREKVFSKWSWGPLIKHAIFDVPTDYGDEVSYYWVSPQAKDFVINLRKEA